MLVRGNNITLSLTSKQIDLLIAAYNQGRFSSFPISDIRISTPKTTGHKTYIGEVINITHEFVFVYITFHPPGIIPVNELPNLPAKDSLIRVCHDGFNIINYNNKSYLRLTIPSD